MGTCSAIGYRRCDGSIRAVYCHWDGYPDHHLPILKEHYNTLRKVQALIRPGSMSSLRSEETWESDYQRDKHGRPDFTAPKLPRRKPQPLYHHERGQGPWCAGDGSYSEPPQLQPGLLEAKRFWSEYCCEHLYVFYPGEGWVHHELD